MVECQLPKLDVAGSNPVSRSIESITWEDPKITRYSVFFPTLIQIAGFTTKLPQLRRMFAAREPELVRIKSALQRAKILMTMWPQLRAS